MENHHAINGKTHYKWPFSMAMLVYQRVTGAKSSTAVPVHSHHDTPRPWHGESTIFRGPKIRRFKIIFP